MIGHCSVTSGWVSSKVESVCYSKSPPLKMNRRTGVFTKMPDLFRMRPDSSGVSAWEMNSSYKQFLFLFFFKCSYISVDISSYHWQNIEVCQFDNHYFQKTKQIWSWVSFVKDEQQLRVITIVLSFTDRTSPLLWGTSVHNEQASHEQLNNSRDVVTIILCFVKENLCCMSLSLMCSWLLKYLLQCSLAERGSIIEHQLNKNMTSLLNLCQYFTHF